MSPLQDRLATGQGLVAYDLRTRLHRYRSYLSIIAGGAAIAGWLGWQSLSPDTKWAVEAAMMAKFKLSVVQAVASPSDLVTLPPPADQTPVSASRVLATPPIQHLVARARVTVTLAGIAGGILGGLTATAWSLWMEESGAAGAKDRPLRGASVVSEAALRRRAKRRAGAHPVTIGTVPIPSDLEPRHFALIGATGSGKSTVLRAMLDTIETRGDAAVLYDVSGEFTANYYRPDRGDVILSAFDARSVYWNPMDELIVAPDAERIAAQLIPDDGPNDDAIWTNMARSLLANMMRYLWKQGRTDLASLLDMVRNASPDELKASLGDTSSARTFEASAERASASVLFNLAKPSNLLQFLRAAPGIGGTFSFKSYFADLDKRPGSKPWVFIQRREEHFEATKALIGCWLECAASGILSLEPNASRRVWLILDEFPELPRVSNIQRLLPLGRKYGARVVVAFQAIGQLRAKYGKDAAEALLGQCNTKLILQLSDADTRKWASENVGDAELELRSESSSLSVDSGHSRRSLSSQRQIRPVLIESQFRLARYQGFLILPDGYPVAAIRVTNDHVRRRGTAREPGFVAGDIADTLWGKAPVQTAAAGPILPEQGPV